MLCQKKRFFYFIIFAEKLNFANSENSNYTVISVSYFKESRLQGETGKREILQNVRHCASGTGHGCHVPILCPKQRK